MRRNHSQVSDAMKATPKMMFMAFSLMFVGWLEAEAEAVGICSLKVLQCSVIGFHLFLKTFSFYSGNPSYLFAKLLIGDYLVSHFSF